MGEVVSNPASDPSPRSRSKEGAKHTSGEWYVTQQRFSRHDGIALEGDKIPVVKMCGACEAIVASVGCSAAEAESNASLIAEAGTVATETGLTPRQLAEQRAELLALLKITTEFMAASLEDDLRHPAWEDVRRARAAIAKAEGGAS